MNFQALEVLHPLNVLVVNPLSMAGQMLCSKIICGSIFGTDQLIHLILSANPHEKRQAEDFVLELRSCGFSTMNSVVISTELPKIADADVFIIITDFNNPNIVNFNESLRKNVDAVYSVINIALSLAQSISVPEEPIVKSLKNSIEVKQKHKPLFYGDGIVTLNILKYFLKDILPSDVFICPNPLPAIARQVLGEHLRTTTDLLNTLYVWGADDQTFYIEVALPVVLSEHKQDGSEIQCNQKIIGDHIMDRLNYDVTNFNEAWMKKDFIEKTHASSVKNTYGDIYRASAFTKTLRRVWVARCAPDGVEIPINMGIISDGSLKTIKGFAYFLPVLLSGDTWRVNERFSETSYLQQEIQRFNKSVKAFKEIFNPYCKKFMKDNETKPSLAVTETDSFTSYGIRSKIGPSSMTHY